MPSSPQLDRTVSFAMGGISEYFPRTIALPRQLTARNRSESLGGGGKYPTLCGGAGASTGYDSGFESDWPARGLEHSREQKRELNPFVHCRPQD